MRGNRALSTSATRWGRRLLRMLVDGVFALIIRRQIVGLENIPPEGGCVLVFNHLSNFDAPLLFSVMRRPKLTALFATDYRERLVHRVFIEAMGGIWIKRDTSDRTSLNGRRYAREPLERRGDLQRALLLLEQGWLVGISPEGRRSPSKALIEGRRGPAFLAMQTRVPILPVALTNTEKIASSLKRLQRVTVTIRFGQTMVTPPLEPGNEKQQLQAVTDYYMTRLATLLPPEYRGIYANFPAEETLSTD